MIRLTREQVRRLDRVAVDVYRIPGIVLMENAARELECVAGEMLAAVGRSDVLILCGGGNNGGDGLAAARHLHNRGIKVRILLATDPQKFQGDAEINWQIAQAMHLPTQPLNPAALVKEKTGLLVDAIFGTGLDKPPRPPFAEIAAAINANGSPILAVDVPSGLDCDSGVPLGPACVKATKTITFVAEKIGFAKPTAQRYLGEIIVGDIGCPRQLVDDIAAGRC